MVNVNVKETQSGKLAVILPNTDESKRLILAVFGGVMFGAGFTGLQTAEAPALSVSDAQKYEAAKASKSDSKKAPRAADYDYDSLTPEQKALEDTRYEIIAAISEYAREVGRIVTKDNLGGFYTQFYATMRRETGYFPTRKTVLTYYHPYVGSKINTILKDGRGRDFLRLIHREIRSLKGRAIPKLNVKIR